MEVEADLANLVKEYEAEDTEGEQEPQDERDAQEQEPQELDPEEYAETEDSDLGEMGFVLAPKLTGLVRRRGGRRERGGRCQAPVQ